MKFHHTIGAISQLSSMRGVALAAAFGAAVTGSTKAMAADAEDGFLSSWLDMVARNQAEQPHWQTPLATTTPQLEQELRLDFYSEELPAGQRLNNYGAGKGIEFIPADNIELFVGIPPYETKSSNTGTTLGAGWGDWTPFVLKYRFASASADQGDYVVSGLLQLTAPTGEAGFSNHFYVVQPSFAFGKGWGNLDVQATVGAQFAAGGAAAAERNYGDPVLINATVQYNAFAISWPEFEVNATWWPNGVHGGKIQTFLTPGLILGRFGIAGRESLNVGAGYQIAVSPSEPGYRNNLVVTARLTF